MMRVSTVKGDPGYTPLSAFYLVYLDGVQLKHCYTADDELGIADCYARDEDGKLAVIGGELMRERRRGDVVIKWVGAGPSPPIYAGPGQRGV